MMNETAVKNQRKHYRVLKLQMVFLLLVAGTSSVSLPASFTASKASGIGILLVLILLVNSIAQIRKYDRRWFSCRAVAESVKVQTWRFMMRADPYASDSDFQSVRGKFVDDVMQSLNSQREAILEVGSKPVERTQITRFMEATRKKSLDERRHLYVEQRIQDQKVWYSKKAFQNSKAEARWFVFSFAMQALSAIVAFVVVFYSTIPVNPVGFITTAAMAGISWTNARSHRELSQSYGLVAQELAGLEDKASEVASEESLGKFVIEVERTISREHTLWKARRLGTL